jgi:hypothetical protein
MKRYKVYGPVQDGMFTCWHVIGPRGGFVAEFLSRKAAAEFITKRVKVNVKKEKVKGGIQ